MKTSPNQHAPERFQKSFRQTFLLTLAGVLVLEIAAFGQYVPPASGLVSWWRGEGSGADSVGANNGSLVGGVSIVTGKVGSGFGFNGTSSYISVPNNASLNFSSALTIGLWYKPADGFFNSYGLIAKRVGATGANYGINNSSFAGMGVYYDDPTVQDGDDTIYGSVFEASRYTPSPAPGQFHHLAATYLQVSANVVELNTYLDGLLVRTKQISGNLANTLNTSPVTIGASATGGGEFFKGIIDEVTLYNRALSPSEVLTLATVPEPSTAALVGIALVGLFAKRRATQRTN